MELPELVLDFRRVLNCLRDLDSQQLAIAASQPMDRDLDGALLEARAGGALGQGLLGLGGLRDARGQDDAPVRRAKAGVSLGWGSGAGRRRDRG